MASIRVRPNFPVRLSLETRSFRLVVLGCSPYPAAARYPWILRLVSCILCPYWCWSPVAVAWAVPVHSAIDVAILCLSETFGFCADVLSQPEYAGGFDVPTCAFTT